MHNNVVNDATDKHRKSQAQISKNNI